MLAFPAIDRVHRFFQLSWLLLAVHVSTLTSASQYASAYSAFWTLAATFSYSFFYLLPALAGGYLARWLCGRLTAWQWRGWVMAAVLTA